MQLALWNDGSDPVIGEFLMHGESLLARRC
jgi:hypothetical protein